MTGSWLLLEGCSGDTAPMRGSPTAAAVATAAALGGSSKADAGICKDQCMHMHMHMHGNDACTQGMSNKHAIAMEQYWCRCKCRHHTRSTSPVNKSRHPVNGQTASHILVPHWTGPGDQHWAAQAARVPGVLGQSAHRPRSLWRCAANGLGWTAPPECLKRRCGAEGGQPLPRLRVAVWLGIAGHACVGRVKAAQVEQQTDRQTDSVVSKGKGRQRIPPPPHFSCKGVLAQ